MALTKCPECGKEISDKVKSCPHCGYPFETPTEGENDLQKVEITSVNIQAKDTKKLKNILIGVIAGLFFIAIVFAAFMVVDNAKKKEAFNKYIDDLIFAKTTMVAGGSEAETLCNLTGRVWSNAIWQKWDIETNDFTMPNGVFTEDFNVALKNLYSDEVTLSTISRIASNQEQVAATMRELKNPPKGLEKSYENISALYTAYKALTDTAISPSGSLQTYSEGKTAKVEKFMELFNALETQMPEKE